MVRDNTIIVLVAEAILGLAIVFVPDPSIKAAAVGAAIGIVGGHLNGSNGGAKTENNKVQP